MEPIKIMVLGMSGAGKTVYLASLYQKLAVLRPDSCYVLGETRWRGTATAEIAVAWRRFWQEGRHPIIESKPHVAGGKRAQIRSITSPAPVHPPALREARRYWRPRTLIEFALGAIGISLALAMIVQLKMLERLVT